MDKQFQIVLSPLDLGQVLDGLEIRAQSWRDSAEFVESGRAPSDEFICEDCNDAEEAAAIALHYERIVESIRKQVDEQGGW